MSFTFTNEDGMEVRDIMSCTECIYLSTKHHFVDGELCPLCRSPAERLRTLETDTSMSRLQYTHICDHLKDNANGVGKSTIEGIRTRYEDGNDFLDVCRRAYEQQDYDGLTELSGVGESTARNIAIAMAKLRDWEGGLAESSFKLG